MELETAERIYSKNVTADELTKAFEDDHGRGEFIILSQSKETYMQASGELDGPYIVEHREGDADHHFQCTQEIAKQQVQDLFMKYLQGDSSWKKDVQWKQLENKPWWKFW